MRSQSSTIETRFWSHVVKSDGCWEWQASRSSRGYGGIKVKGKTRLTHRVAYELTYGPIPTGLFVCHHCDNPVCVRPDHLFVGTSADNNHDMVAKGRHIHGSNCFKARLTEDQVSEMRATYAQGDVRQVDLAKAFGITQSEVSKILRRTMWQHVT